MILVLLQLLFPLRVCVVALKIYAHLSDTGSDDEYIHSIEVHHATHRNVRRGTRANRCPVSAICGDMLACAVQ